MQKRKITDIRKVGKGIVVLTICILLLFIFVFTTKSSYLLYIAKDTQTNILTLPYVYVTINEDFPPILSWTPNTIVTKKVNFHNTGNMDILLRCSYLERWDQANEAILSNTFDHDGNPATTEIDVVDKGWSRYWPFYSGADKDAQWMDGGDGYFYYTKVLKAGEVTKPILENLTLNELAPSVYSQKEYQLNFKIEAMYVNANSAYSYWGKHPVIESDDVIRW